jgi:ribosomal protein S18 acetylase RimI-like enzyme
MSANRQLTRGDGRLRVATWRGDTSTAFVTPVRGPVKTTVVERWLGDLARDGFRAVLTPALGTAEQAPFLASGFTVHERLHLLTRDVDDLPHPTEAAALLRRSRRADRARLLAVDGSAFPDFWRLDDDALADALAATPSSRLRVADTGSPRLAGYAITGRAGPRGYLQRLAVDPAEQRRGIATALVVDGLRWLRRWGAREVLVNTQEHNAAALALYEALGFRRQAEGLAVLRRSVEAPW